MSSQFTFTREFAALAFALGKARGELYSCKNGDSDLESIESMLRATSLQNIAKALGICESEIAVDWNEFLTKQELDTLRGEP